MGFAHNPRQPPAQVIVDVRHTVPYFYKYENTMLIRHNEYLDKRLSGVLKTLVSAHEASKPLSSSSKGNEREWFVSNLLSLVFPNQYRFSSGEVTDRYGKITGQVDIVIEYPHRYSLAAYQDGPRLFMAESVAVAIEVKSDLVDQWSQVTETVRKIKDIRRTYKYQYWENRLNELESGIPEGGKGQIESDPVNLAKLKQFASRQMAFSKGKGTESIPVFVVGYEGWEKAETLRDKVKTSQVDGIFQVNKPMFSRGGYVYEGNSSVFQFLNSLEYKMNEIVLLESSEDGYMVSS